MITFQRGEQPHTLLSVRFLTSEAIVLRLTRQDFDFLPGQHLTLGIPGVGELREYSIYSAPSDGYLEVLIKLIPQGKLTPRLAGLKPGDTLTVDGPNGYFTLNEQQRTKPQLFIATGTGIAPFHSMVRSFPALNYTLIHGIALPTEQYDRQHYHSDNYLSCTSRQPGGDFHGRITQFLLSYPKPAECEVMLCGNSQMILDVWELLLDEDFPMDKVRQEIYF